MDKRPEFEDYFMRLAFAVRERANCLGKKVGAVLVVEERVVSTGYNGTPGSMPNCNEGACDRCAAREEAGAGEPKFAAGEGYDVCICVHAEQNALLAAARFGIASDGGLVYVTLQPCFGCLKEMIQANIQGVRYRHAWEHPDRSLKTQYDALKSVFPERVTQLETPDPAEDWAQGKPVAGSDSGHVIQF